MEPMELRLDAQKGVLPESASPEMYQIVEYWRSLFRGDIMPDRRDIDPTEIPRLLPDIFLIDIFHNPYRFKFRLIGEATVAYHGRNLANL